MYKISLVSGLDLDITIGGAGIIFLHSNSYFLTGILCLKVNEINDTVLIFTDIKYHVQWIRGILNEDVRKYICIYWNLFILIFNLLN